MGLKAQDLGLYQVYNRGRYSGSAGKMDGVSGTLGLGPQDVKSVAYTMRLIVARAFSEVTFFGLGSEILYLGLYLPFPAHDVVPLLCWVSAVSGALLPRSCRALRKTGVSTSAALIGAALYSI